jgi:hypothetical protein
LGVGGFGVGVVVFFGGVCVGVGGVVSNHAVLDPDFRFHRSLLSSTRLAGSERRSRMWRSAVSTRCSASDAGNAREPGVFERLVSEAVTSP